MAKIAVFDPYLRKFTAGMEKYWLAAGHEVRMDRYYNPEWALWADVIWFDTVDNNLKSATNPGEAIMDDAANFQPWDLHKMDLTGKKIIARAIDIEVWQGHQHGSIWDVVTDCISIAPHVYDMMALALPENVKQHMIPCAVDLDNYRFRARTPGPHVAVISEKWTSKGTDLILQIALRLQQRGFQYKFHWLGRWSDHEWEQAYFNDFIERKGLDFEFTEWIEGENAVDEFLEDKNYLLHASHKEGFSYATAEAMAKGVKPVTHRFFGGEELWPNLPLWDSIDQAVNMLSNEHYDSYAYRQYLVDHGYTLPQMMEQFDKVINN